MLRSIRLSRPGQEPPGCLKCALPEALAVFAWWQAKAAHPLLPLRIVADRNRAASYLSVLIVSAGVFGVSLFLTYYLQQVLGYSPVKTGLAFLPMTATLVVSTYRLLVDHLQKAVAGVTDPVARLHAVCRAYVTFGLEHPHQYRVLFARNTRLRAAGPWESVSTMPGAEAFAFLLDGIQACVDAGRSRSTEPVEDATALWVALHGYVGLQTGVPDFPWPPDDRLNRHAHRPPRPAGMTQPGPCRCTKRCEPRAAYDARTDPARCSMACA